MDRYFFNLRYCQTTNRFAPLLRHGSNFNRGVSFTFIPICSKSSFLPASEILKSLMLGSNFRPMFSALTTFHRDADNVDPLDVPVPGVSVSTFSCSDLPPVPGQSFPLGVEVPSCSCLEPWNFPIHPPCSICDRKSRVSWFFFMFRFMSLF